MQIVTIKLDKTPSIKLRRIVRGDVSPLTVTVAMNTVDDKELEVGGDFVLMDLLKTEAVKNWLTSVELAELRDAVNAEIETRNAK